MFKKRLKKTWEEVRFVLYITLFVVGVMGLATSLVYILETFGWGDTATRIAMMFSVLLMLVMLSIFSYQGILKIKRYIVWQFVEPYRDWKQNKGN